MYELKLYKRFMCHENKEWCKIWTEIGGSVQNWYEEFNHFLTPALKNLNNFHFNGLILTKIYNVWALKIDTKFEGKLTCASKNDIRNFANFHQSTFKSLKSWTFLGSFYQK